jgi:hypothetical protein
MAGLLVFMQVGWRGCRMAHGSPDCSNSQAEDATLTLRQSQEEYWGPTFGFMKEALFR